jgi:hypothetical protein
MDEFAQRDACDGFILVPHLTPGGLDRFVAEVVPELQDRGSYRTAYPGTDPARPPRPSSPRTHR